MIFPASFEHKTGFDQIRQMLHDYCLCELGKRWLNKMTFGISFEKVAHELDLTEDLRQILLFEENFPQENYIDVTACLTKIRTAGSYPEVAELKDLRKSIRTIRELEHFFRKPENKEKYKTICQEFTRLQYFPFLGERIDAILTKEGTIKDSASAELKAIRQEISQKQVQVTRRMQAILKSARQEGLVDPDAEVTLRNGRPVIPVATGNKRKLAGFIHDESASGKTVFIEPGVVVELNNELRELEYAERREIIRILVHFADDIHPYVGDLLETYDSLGAIDFIRAKAELAIQLKCVKPVLGRESGFVWKHATHPLLYLSHLTEGEEVVPLDIGLHESNRILVISGPNAGGKSVCLKTVGLLQYMLQCGLLVPMSENSEACLFDKLFIDIGDEQSLENDLSTYSSHLLNMKQFVRSADEHTLFLVDEFGSGTEPALGGAIAEAILEALNNKGAYGIVTTHYTNLKHFASETPGIINGAMLFDIQKIQPIFKLSIGKPGSSFALDIARNIGLPEEIVKKASEKVGSDYINYEKHLREIIRDKKYWEEKRMRIRKVEKTLDELYSNYSTELEDIQKERKKIMMQARDEAQALLKEANRNIERTIREIKESHAEKKRTHDARGNLESYRKQLNDSELQPDTYNKKIRELHQAGKRLISHSAEIRELKLHKESEKAVNTVKIKVGDIVQLIGFDTAGEVLEANEKTLLVAFGNMITSVECNKVELSSPGKMTRSKKSRTLLADDIQRRKLNFKSEIDVRGLRGDEALLRVQELLDGAAFVGVRNLKILHGKGNGILRQLIRDYLKTIDYIRSVSDEHADHGGTGVTLIELDM